ncbi:cell adhesion molecule 2-like isoform X2 [Homarus americanus]|uniref:cell adhesion molecule 2-like isoform X2 n=1 Tax=Homarus americanus TaxID=6706 RepID=UPI001C47F721|nr:cell adhesion molecule 2-like isoform X2 [Homarus americanus]
MEVWWVMTVWPLLVTAHSGHSGGAPRISPAPPKFVHPAHNVTVVEGQEVTLMCSVTNLHGYKLAWVHEETQSILSIGRDLYTRTPRLSLHADRHSAGLTISPVLSTDRGWYMCQLNTEPMTSSRSYLQVLVPPTLEEWSGSYVEVREGAKVRLTCRARAFPPALTTWRRTDANPIFRTPRTVWAMEGSVLVFESVRREHSGAYTCHVDNNATSPVSRTTHLTITYGPVLWLGKDLVGTKAGLDVTLNCTSVANPPPRHYWEVNGVNITNSDKYQVKEVKASTRTEVLLTVRRVSDGDFTRYDCHAVSPTGHAHGTIKVYKIKDPILIVPTRPWRVIQPGKAPPYTYTTRWPSTPSRNTSFNNTHKDDKTHLGDSLRTTKFVTNMIPSPSGSWKSPGRSGNKHPNQIKYKHRGGLSNSTTLVVVDVAADGGGRARYVLPSSLTPLTILLLHLLLLNLVGFG